MIHSSALLADLKAQLRVLQADLKARADDATTEWGAALQREHAEALRRQRTGLSWSAWRDNEVDQAAVAWIVATTFIRFCEDNDLLVGATLDGMPVAVGWIAGPGDRTARARENQTAYFRVHTTHHDRDWLQHAFRVLAAQPAGAALVDPKHNPVWTAEISAEAANGLVNFWRRTDEGGTLVHDFTDREVDTRFLGDLYQDLSEHAKKTYALLQTPEFVEEFILDRTLTPAIAEFGIENLKVIDPTCGSGHFLLGTFARLNEQWAAQAPRLDPNQRVRKAMDSIHGVDLNPFAVAIARFRLTVAGITAAGDKSLVGVPPLGFHLAIGDSLLGEQGGGGAGLFDDNDTFAHGTEDLDEYAGILKPGRYHVVVGNPPYITVKDPSLNKAYRSAYYTAYRKYQLTAPFMELFFRLCVRGAPGRGAGYVGKITSNAFMTREFGKRVVDDLLSGRDPNNPVDLTSIIDSSGAWMAGHNFDGTPTVILFGRHRPPVDGRIRAVLGIQGEPGRPSDPARGPVWSEIVAHIDDADYTGRFVSVENRDRAAFSRHPWSLNGGNAGATMSAIVGAGHTKLESYADSIGFSVITGDDEFLAAPMYVARRMGLECPPAYVVGDEVRDWHANASLVSLVPATLDGSELEPTSELSRFLWRGRKILESRQYFNKTPSERGLRWFDYAIQFPTRNASRLKIVFAFVATHNHFVLDRGGRVFKQSAPVITLASPSSELDHSALLAVLNSSAACFWIKEVSYAKDKNAEPWATRYEVTGTKLLEFPVPETMPQEYGARLVTLAEEADSLSPRALVSELATSRLDWSPELVDERRSKWMAARERMIFEQEELDWATYSSYELVHEDLTYVGAWAAEQRRIALGQRAFEIALARDGEASGVRHAWFERHGSRTFTDLPAQWPDDYRQLVERRLQVMRSDRNIGMVEQPQYKRRWAGPSWDDEIADAAAQAVLDCLSDPALWQDSQGPAARSVAQVVDLLRGESAIPNLSRALTGSAEPDVAAVVASLVKAHAVPYVAAYRFKGSGLEKFVEWQATWESQRQEDLGGPSGSTVPPAYGKTDYQRDEYWAMRGKFDVPKERFILYPGMGREGDTSSVLGWAGWSHRDQAVALVREIQTQQTLGASDEALVPMVAGLVELEPWLHQWHTDLEPEFGSSAAQAVTSQIDQLLAQLQLTRDDVNAWRPPAPARGRRRRA